MEARSTCVNCLVHSWLAGRYLAVGLPQHPDEHRPERPILLAVDQQLGEGAALWVAPELADPLGALEVGKHQDVKQLGAGSRPESVEALPKYLLELGQGRHRVNGKPLRATHVRSLLRYEPSSTITPTTRGVQYMSSPLPPPPSEARRRSTPFWKRWWFWAIVVVVILIAAAAGLDLSEGGDEGASTPTGPTVTAPTGPTSPSPPPSLEVPDVVGMSTADATNALQEASLTVSVEKRYSNEAKGTVLKQTPRSRLEVTEGTTVALIVAQPLPVIPNVVGDKFTAARRTLENRDFDVRVKRETSSQPKDTVLRQSPTGGTSARPGRTVLLVVAKQAPPTPSGDCQGYSPCILPGPDVDCAGGSGDGPRYVSGPVQVNGSDPYGLDSDGDGIGCE